MLPEGPTIRALFSDAARRGVVVKGLVWRSHLDTLQFSEEENQHLGEAIEAAGGEVLLDQRVRLGGSHHQKMVVLRHPGRPQADVAFVGGIDLCHGRRDDADHGGDPQPMRMNSRYGDHPPWHDVQDDGGEDDGLLDPDDVVATVVSAARRLDDWHAGGRHGSRPPGRLRRHQPERVGALRRLWSVPVYRMVYDPDGRSYRDRLAGRW